jgi:FG-GAP-like repeat
MLARKFPMLICAAAAATAALAQTAPQQAPPKTSAVVAAEGAPEGGEPKYIRPETEEQRKARLGTAEDPGTNPDQSKHFWRFGHSFHIERFDRQWASYDNVEPGFVKPFAFVNVVKEIYQQNDKYVWVWMVDVTPEELAAMQNVKPPSRFTDKQMDYFKRIRTEFFETTPKQSNVTVRFEESSQGLPTAGSWRNSGTIADMNGDGCPDIVAPPERGGGQVPAVFLGDCKGHWRYWTEAKWPRSVDYGSVVAADFNKDGHMDVAFGVHLTGVYVFLGDGKGNFTDASEGLPTGFPTRRVAVADVDGDGWPDVVSISEGPTSARQNAAGLLPGRIRAFLNRDHGKKWETIQIAGNDIPVAGDWLSVGHFSGGKAPEFVAANIFFNSADTIFLASAPKQWKSAATPENNLTPYLSNYYASAVGKFSGGKRDDAIVSYVRSWPTDLEEELVPAPPAKTIIGIDRISFAGPEPKRTPIVRWGGNRAVWGLAAGDFDHDGSLDFLYTRYDPREAVLMLGDGKGGFTRAKIDGITLAPNTNYDLLVADVNGDGLPDVVVMYESMGKTMFAQRDGSIHAFLNRGVEKVDTTQKTTSK